MCGIVGIVTKKNRGVKGSLIDILRRLEYRGYDSCGLALINDNVIKVSKTTKGIDILEVASSHIVDSNIGIAHTRWATHGKVDGNNAHPFVSTNGKWAIVHNGIIDNYVNLKQQCLNEGLTFSSDTDSEVVSNLL